MWISQDYRISVYQPFMHLKNMLIRLKNDEMIQEIVGL